MAMPEGTLKWATLAKMANQEVYDYFRNTRKQTHKHALNSTRKVRSMFDTQGNRHPREIFVPYNFFEPKTNDKVQVEEFAPMQYEQKPEISGFQKLEIPSWTESKLELGERIHSQFESKLESWNPPAPATPQESEEMPQNDNAASALAALIAPAMAGMVTAEISKAVAKLHENMAPVRHLVYIKDKVETNLGELHHKSAPKLLQLIHQGLNVMLVGPAGCGKTMLAETVAQGRKRELTIVSCSAGMSEAQLLGRLLPLGAGGAFTYVESPFMRAYANGGVILLDEMDAADANLLLVINAALANGGITVEARAALGPEHSTYVKRHADTAIIAATNTWGSGADTQYIGRGALDVSTLDRFYRVAVDYDTDLENKLGAKKTVQWVQKLREAARRNKLRRVVSTRMITRIEKALAADVAFGEACADELASWTADERAKVGE